MKRHPVRGRRGVWRKHRCLVVHPGPPGDRYHEARRRFIHKLGPACALAA